MAFTQDLRHALRGWLKSPGVLAIAVLSVPALVPPPASVPGSVPLPWVPAASADSPVASLSPPLPKLTVPTSSPHAVTDNSRVQTNIELVRITASEPEPSLLRSRYVVRAACRK